MFLQALPDGKRGCPLSDATANAYLGITAWGTKMDDEEILTPHLKCDVELELSGPNGKTVNKWAADALRDLADRLERDEFEDGFSDVKDRVGKKIGTIYVDYSLADF